MKAEQPVFEVTDIEMVSVGELPAGVKILDMTFHGTTLVVATDQGVYAARAGEKLAKLEPSNRPVFTEVRHGRL